MTNQKKQKESKYVMFGELVFQERWFTSQLYKSLKGLVESIGDDKEFKSCYMYYLKIHGWYNKSLCDDNRFKQLLSEHYVANMNNHYNALLNDKEYCLVLQSSYPDFKQYEACMVIQEDKKEHNEGYVSIVEYYGKRRSLLGKIIKSIKG